MQFDVAFPKLNIYIERMINSFTVFNFSIALYGIIISIAMLVGFFVILQFAKKSNQNIETYYDLFIFVIVFSIIGARLYYVLFNWDYYKENIKEIYNLRAGGLAIYGGVIFGAIVAIIYAKFKKISFLVIADTGVLGLAIGQAIGRWGNFVNMEAFGDYTDNILAMLIKKSLVSSDAITVNMLYNLQHINGETYIQVHPTFLYESISCLIIFFILKMVFLKRKKYGIVVSLYMVLYGIVRFFIEGLRTDSLFFYSSSIKVSQIVSIIIVIIGIIYIAYINFLNKNNICDLSDREANRIFEKEKEVQNHNEETQDENTEKENLNVHDNQIQVNMTEKSKLQSDSIEKNINS